MKNKLPTQIIVSLLALSTATSFAQSNDDFANATIIPTTLPFTANAVDNTAATAEGDEPDHGESTFFFNVASNSLWYTFTPTTDLALSVEMQNSSAGLDGIISLYTGSSVNSLTLVNETNLEGANFNETLVTQLSAGTQYYFAIDSASQNGQSQATGTFDLSVTEVPIPANDDFANPTVIPTTLPITISGEDNRGASAESGEPVHGNFISFNELTSSLWYSYTPTVTSFVTITVTPENDFADNIIAIYTGTSLANLELVTERDSVFEGEEETTTVLLTAGTQYLIATEAVAEFDTFSSSGKYDITFTNAVSVPSNNDIANAENLGSSSTAQTTGTTVGADTESTDPADTTSSGNITSQTVWYTWTPSTAGDYNIITESFGFSPYTVSAMTGSPANLSVIAASAARAGRGGTGITITATANTTYYISFDGYDDGTLQFSDEFDLEICPAPENDRFADSTNLGSAAVISIDGDSTCASAEEDEPDHADDFIGNDASASLWYTWTAPSNGRWEVTIANSDFEYIVAIHQGNTIDTLTEIISGDEIGSSTDEDTIILMATSGTTYHIAVDGFDRGGPFTLNLANLDPVPVAVPEIKEFTRNPSTGQFSIEFISEPNQTYSLTSSPDLMDWSTIVQSTILATSGTTTEYTFNDSSADKRFYRITRN